MDSVNNAIIHFPLSFRSESEKTQKFSWLNKAKNIICCCARTISSIAFLPLRYFGSKTWSIPGVVLRTPWIIFKRIFIHSDRSIVQEMFPSHYRRSFEKVLTPAELKPYYSHACATAFVHKNKEGFIPVGWNKISPIAHGLTLSGAITNEDCLFDPSSNFKVSFIEKDDQIIVAFGSLEVDGGAIPVKKSRNSKSINIVGCMIGLTPKVLRQGDEFVQSLKKHPCFQNKKITLTGNSYGATIASYAGLKNEVSAICFNSFPLGAGLQWNISNSQLQNADQYITHISAEGDYVTDLKCTAVIDVILSSIGLKMPGNFGRRLKIPSAYKKKQETHGFILGSVMAHIGHDKRTIPCELKNL